MSQVSDNIPVRYVQAHLKGYLNKFFKSRRSRKGWPSFNDSLLWIREELYEYKKQSTLSELIDVVGTLAIQSVIYDNVNRDVVLPEHNFTRHQIRMEIINWWLRQISRGRPTWSLTFTYYTLKLNLIQHAKKANRR